MNLKSRLEILEKKLLCDEDGRPSCVIIVPESGRLNVEPDTSKIIRLTSDGIIYDRKPEESEESFIERVAKEAEANLLSPSAVPCLLAVTENMMQAD